MGLARLHGSRSLGLAAVCGVLFLTFLDNTVVSVALADIQTSLGAGVSALQWIVDGYMLAFAALMLTGGTLGDLLGRKRVMLAGVALFCAGSVVSALATGASVLIGGRVIMGVGAAASEPGTLSLIRHIYPERGLRARAFGVWSAVSGLALALGPMVGGVLVAGVGWRGVFWFNLAFGALAFAVAAVTLRENSDPAGRRLDVPGLLIGAATLVAATFAVIEGETVGYDTWWIIALLGGAVAGALLFLAVERRAPDPAVKLTLLRAPTFAGSNVVAFTTNFAVFAVFFFTALYLQLVASFSGWEIALQFVSLAFAMVVAGLVGGRWTARAGPRAPMVCGCIIGGAGILAVDALLDPHVGLTSLAWALALVGFGFGLALATMTSAVLERAPAERSGTAASTLNTSRELGGVFGVAVLGALMTTQLTAQLTGELRRLGIPPNFRSIVIDAVTHGVSLPSGPGSVSNPAAAGHQALVTKVIDAAEGAFGSGLHVALVVAAALLLASAPVAALTIGRESRRRSVAADGSAMPD
jgi:EmrB/QacA subfamily drug resistance transporter